MSEPIDPLLKVHGGGYPDGEVLMTDLLDWYFSNTVGSVAQRGATGWRRTSGLVYPITFDVAGTISVANDVAPWRIIPKDGIGMRVWAWCKTLPAVQTIKFDIMRSPWDLITGQGAFASIFTADQKPQVVFTGGGANGYYQPNVTTHFTAGDVFRLDILQVGTGTAGADMTVVMQCAITDPLE